MQLGCEIGQDGVSAVMLDAMELALQADRPPLVAAGNMLATACVVAAVLHPEWAVAIARGCDCEVRELAEKLVHQVSLTLAGDPSMNAPVVCKEPAPGVRLQHPG